MRPNPLRESIRSDSPALGVWLSTPSPITSEVVGRLGFDYACIDMQHGLIGYADAVLMLQALTLSSTTPTVRVPWNEPGIIGKVLDAGAMVVVVPMVNTKEEAEQAVQRGMYPPLGSRSSGPIRVQPVHGAHYAEVANEHIQIIPMIETVEALGNIDDILSVEGVDAIYVGPMDLGVSMGLGRGTTDPSFLDALDPIVERCREHGVIPGIHASPEAAQDRLDRGFRMVTVQSDLTAMTVGLREALAAGRGGAVDDGGAPNGY